jgi:phosphatidylinositol alpha-1,6-mannosyltransferase
MKVLVITWNYPPRRGGIEYLMGHLVGTLKKKHSIVVITAHAPGSCITEENVYRVPWPGLIPFAFYALWRGAWTLRSRDIEVIFGGSVMVTPLVLILARLFGRKAVVQSHGLDVAFPKALYQFLCVRWLRFCDRIVANSVYTASLAVKKNVAENFISVIPPGINPDVFSSSRNCESSRKFSLLAGKQIILFVGRLTKRKGVKEFIERSLARIIREVPNACFAIVGGNPSESLTQRDDTLGEIKAVIAELNLQSYVELLGALDDEDVIKIYQLAQVVVLPALPTSDDVEGFGIVLLEAAAAGKPTVATRVGGIPDAIDDGKSGILVEPSDYDGLCQAVISLLKNRDQSVAMGKFGQRRVKEQFAWSKITALYEAAFDAAAGSSH